MAVSDAVLEAFECWYGALKPLRQYSGRPAKGTVAAALIVLERLRVKCDLELAAHLAPGQAQIAGLNPSALRKILSRLGESRKFPSEGGRTNRGNNAPINELLLALKQAELGLLGDEERSQLIDAMQQRLVLRMDEYYHLERLRFEFDARKPAREIVSEILARAHDRQKDGAVAQHLVGAKLQLRFPSLAIQNLSAAAADEQTGRSGDFKIHGTAFHVTVAPNRGHAAKCSRNLQDGLAVFLIVNAESVDRARYLLDEEGIGTRVAVESIESFVGQNLSEMADFSADRFGHTWRELVEIYNQRVAAAESDASLLIEPPSGL